MKLKYLFFAFLGMTAVCACNGKEEKTETVTATLEIVSPADSKLEFVAAGESKDITFNATRDWTVRTSDTWITVSAKSGSGSSKDQKITVTAPANEGFARNGTVKITNMAGTKTINVSQAAGKEITYSTIAALKAQAGVVKDMPAAGKAVEGEVIVKGIVVSDPTINSLSSNKTLYVMDETAGIQIFCNENVYKNGDENSILFGDEVEVNATGALLYPYGQALELVAGVGSDNKTIGFNNANLRVLSKGNTVTPKSVTLADFMANKYEGSYVKITDKKVQVAESDLTKKWYNVSSGVSNVNLQTQDNSTIVVRVAQYASYKDQTVPQGSGYLQGIAQYYNGTMQIAFADTLQYKTWTDPRFEIEYGAKTIADIYASPEGNVAVDAVVVAAAKQALVLGDATGVLYCHIGADHTWKAGDKVHVEGSVVTYGLTNLIQISGPDSIVASVADVTAPTPATPSTLTAAQIEAYNSNKTEYIQLEGKCVVSGNYVNIEIDGTDVQGSVTAGELASTITDGEILKITGYFGGKTQSKAGVTYINILPATIGSSDTPNFGVSKTEFNVSAKATSVEFDVTGNVEWTASCGNGDVAVTPASGTGKTTVTIEFGENGSTTDARTIEVTVSTTADVATKSYTVTVNQAAASATGAKWNRVTTVGEILAGGTFIIGYEATAGSGIIVPLRSDACAATATANGILYTGTSTASTIVSDSGTINMESYDGTGNYEITITANADLTGAVNLQMKDGKYIGCPGSKNTAKLYDAASESNTAYTVTAKENDTFQLTCEAQKSTAYYFLQYNTGSPRFANYSGGQKNPVFYKYE